MRSNPAISFLAAISLLAVAGMFLAGMLQSCNPNSVMRTLYLPPNVAPDTVGPDYLHTVSQIKYWDRITAADRATNFGWWDSAGKVHEMNEFYNKIVVLNFFGTWSPSSIQQLEVLDSIDGRDTNVLFLAVAMKEAVRGGKAVIRLDSFARARGVPYEVLVGSPDFGDTYGGIDVVPTSFVIDLRRKIAATFEGFATKEKLLDAIAKAESQEE
ncbi:MAG TPA: TlpA disulfide reductase family protein [Candidatus Kapabacteria bacterium]|nr:TlpA disulfide reductase family protein [Candidatus Kapabacteria bacterium]